MKISICIPQYNRIEVLLKSLRMIEGQSYTNVEVVVSDDCSSDQTEAEIKKLQPHYKYPLIYHRFETNQGYDRNFRKSIECATGDYCFVIGNDDTIYGKDNLTQLATFLQENDFPDIGYCNYIEGETDGRIVTRALETKVYGAGIDVAMQHANGFSFVGGIIYKRSAFKAFNTAAHDGSIYTQMYLGLLMIAKGCRLFTIKDVMVLKDLRFEDGSISWSPMRDALPKKWKEARNLKSGLLSVMNVLISACMDAQQQDKSFIYRIMKRMYAVTFPYWLVQYKHHGNHITSLGLISEMNPVKNPYFHKLDRVSKVRIYSWYLLTSAGGLIIPFNVFRGLEGKLHKWVRK